MHVVLILAHLLIGKGDLALWNYPAFRSWHLLQAVAERNMNAAFVLKSYNRVMQLKELCTLSACAANDH